MTALIKTVMALAAALLASQAAAQVTFFENDGYQGRSFTAAGSVSDLISYGFNDRASSAVVDRDAWQVCEDAGFGGRCVVLRPGSYPSLRDIGLNDRVSSVRQVASAAPAPVVIAPAPAEPRVTLYERENFQGRSFISNGAVDNFFSFGFNDRASSDWVERDDWQVCEDVSYGGRCVVLREGRYPSLAAMGLNDSVSSLRVVERYAARGVDGRYSPAQGPDADYRRQGNERLYEAKVIDARAVLGTPEQRCWVEPGQVPAGRGDANVPGGIVGALLGGIIGHQIGGGFGKDIATIGGLAAGAAVGANVGRDSQAVAAQDVRRCESVSGQARTAYWDVTYRFRGQDHRMQMTRPPGATVSVNRQGEPRV
jgi:uncharacterized protein YcfJ